MGDHIVHGAGPTAVSSRLGYLLSGPSGLETKLFNTMMYDILTTKIRSLGRMESTLRVFPGRMITLHSQPTFTSQNHAEGR